VLVVFSPDFFLPHVLFYVLFTRLLPVEGVFVALGDVVEGYSPRNKAEEGCGGQHEPRVGFLQQVTAVEYAEAHKDNDKVDCQHVELSSKVDSGS